MLRLDRRGRHHLDVRDQRRQRRQPPLPRHGRADEGMRRPLRPAFRLHRRHLAARRTRRRLGSFPAPAGHLDAARNRLVHVARRGGKNRPPVPPLSQARLFH
uniref:Uncharacterized protein n=1 Tax=Magnetospirillum gryphiswaldense TaxID=55518 RepID=A4U5I0_9PROT|nr:hypothetical protein MGR_4205 [Magnetospirillum gryphiswaldense MSR-1]